MQSPEAQSVESAPVLRTKEKKMVCGETQFAMHLFLALCMGVFIGVSFVSDSTVIESSLTTYAASQKKTMISVIEKLKTSLDDFKDDFHLMKEMIQKNHQVRCMELNSFYISENPTNEFDIEFFEEFYKKPDIFLSVNGFVYNQTYVKKEGSTEDISFAIVNVTPIGFKFAVHSTLEDFDKNEFDRIDICYFAFLKFDPDELVKHEKEDDS